MRNNAIKASKGKYIFPLDSDDVIAPTNLEIIHKIITNTKYKAVCPLEFHFGETNKLWIMTKPTRWNMYVYNNGLHSSTMFPKSLWEKYDGYDERFKIGAEDFDFFLNFIDDRQPCCQTKEQLFYYRIKPSVASLLQMPCSRPSGYFITGSNRLLKAAIWVRYGTRPQKRITRGGGVYKV